MDEYQIIRARQARILELRTSLTQGVPPEDEGSQRRALITLSFGPLRTALVTYLTQQIARIEEEVKTLAENGSPPSDAWWTILNHRAKITGKRPSWKRIQKGPATLYVKCKACSTIFARPNMKKTWLYPSFEFKSGDLVSVIGLRARTPRSETELQHLRSQNKAYGVVIKVYGADRYWEVKYDVQLHSDVDEENEVVKTVSGWQLSRIEHADTLPAAMPSSSSHVTSGTAVNQTHGCNHTYSGSNSWIADDEETEKRMNCHLVNLPWDLIRLYIASICLSGFQEHWDDQDEGNLLSVCEAISTDPELRDAATQTRRRARNLWAHTTAPSKDDHEKAIDLITDVIAGCGGSADMISKVYTYRNVATLRSIYQSTDVADQQSLIVLQSFDRLDGQVRAIEERLDKTAQDTAEIVAREIRTVMSTPTPTPIFKTQPTITRTKLPRDESRPHLRMVTTTLHRQMRRLAVEQRGFCDGTRGWVIDRVVDAMSSGDGKKMSWISAPHASGKTCISAQIIKLLSKNDDSHIAYHFFHDNGSLSDAVLSTAYQIGSSCGGVFEAVQAEKWQDIQFIKGDSELLFASLVQEVWEDVCMGEGPPNVVVVWDGIDEVNASDRVVLDHLLDRFSDFGFFRLGPTVKMVITSTRPVPSTLEDCTNHRVISLASEVNVADLRVAAEGIVDGLGSRLQDIQPRDVVDALVEKSANLFLFLNGWKRRLESTSNLHDDLHTLIESTGDMPCTDLAHRFCSYINSAFQIVRDSRQKQLFADAIAILVAFGGAVPRPVVSWILENLDYQAYEINIVLQGINDICGGIGQSHTMQLHAGITSWVVKESNAAIQVEFPDELRKIMCSKRGEEIGVGDRNIRITSGVDSHGMAAIAMAVRNLPQEDILYDIAKGFFNGGRPDRAIAIFYSNYDAHLKFTDVAGLIIAYGADSGDTQLALTLILDLIELGETPPSLPTAKILRSLEINSPEMEDLISKLDVTSDLIVLTPVLRAVAGTRDHDGIVDLVNRARSYGIELDVWAHCEIVWGFLNGEQKSKSSKGINLATNWVMYHVPTDLQSDPWFAPIYTTLFKYLIANNPSASPHSSWRRSKQGSWRDKEPDTGRPGSALGRASSQSSSRSIREDDTYLDSAVTIARLLAGTLHPTDRAQHDSAITTSTIRAPKNAIDVVNGVYNTLLRELTTRGRVSQASDILLQSHHDYTTQHFNIVLSSLNKTGSKNCADRVMALKEYMDGKDSVAPNAYTHTCVLVSLCHSLRLDRALAYLRDLCNGDTTVTLAHFNVVMNALRLANRYETLLDVFDSMSYSKTQPDQSAYQYMMEAVAGLCNAGQINDGIEWIVSRFPSLGFPSPSTLAVTQALGNLSITADGILSLFTAMQDVGWGVSGDPEFHCVVLRSMASEGSISDVTDWMRVTMPNYGVVPDRSHYKVVFGCLTLKPKQSYANHLIDIHNDMLQHGIEPESLITTQITTLLCSIEEPDIAIQFLKDLQTTVNITHYNAVLRCYLSIGGNRRIVLKICRQLGAIFDEEKWRRRTGEERRRDNMANHNDGNGGIVANKETNRILQEALES